MKSTLASTLLFTLILMVSCKSSISDQEIILKNENQTIMKKTEAFLEITLKIENENRPKAVAVYSKYKSPFLQKITGATSKDLLIRNEDVQVIHGFETEAQAKAYLTTDLFSKDIVNELGPLLETAPEVRIYRVFK